MQHDAFQDMWSADRRRMEAAVLMNRRLVGALSVGPALAGIRWTAVVELIADALAILLLGSFAADHIAEPRFFIPGIALAACALLLMNVQVRQIVDARRPGYDEPITAVQKRLTRLRVRRLQSAYWILALAVLAWLPLQIVAFKALLGVDAYAFGAAYLWANFFCGVTAAALVIWIARTFGRRLRDVPIARALVDSLGGAALNDARNRLAAIVEFEREDAVR